MERDEDYPGMKMVQFPPKDAIRGVSLEVRLRVCTFVGTAFISRHYHAIDVIDLDHPELVFVGKRDKESYVNIGGEDGPWLFDDIQHIQVAGGSVIYVGEKMVTSRLSRTMCFLALYTKK
jgi:hypothetical protein